MFEPGVFVAIDTSVDLTNVQDHGRLNNQLWAVERDLLPDIHKVSRSEFVDAALDHGQMLVDQKTGVINSFKTSVGEEFVFFLKRGDVKGHTDVVFSHSDYNVGVNVGTTDYFNSGLENNQWGFEDRVQSHPSDFDFNDTVFTLEPGEAVAIV